MIGLLDASKRFDPNLGIKFSTYAYKYILGEVTKFIRENTNLKVGRDILKLKSSIEKTKDYLRQKLEREPTNVEISLILEIDEEKIDEIERITTSVKSLDYTIDEQDNLYNSIRVEEDGMKESLLDLKEEIKKLDEEDKRIIYSRYYYDMTQSETSKELGISQVQVSRKEAKILKKLKTNLLRVSE